MWATLTVDTRLPRAPFVGLSPSSLAEHGGELGDGQEDPGTPRPTHTSRSGHQFQNVNGVSLTLSCISPLYFRGLAYKLFLS